MLLIYLSGLIVTMIFLMTLCGVINKENKRFKVKKFMIASTLVATTWFVAIPIGIFAFLKHIVTSDNKKPIKSI